MNLENTPYRYLYTIIFSLVLAPSFVEAALNKQIVIKSTPTNADVFIKNGTRTTPIGKTPLIYKAKFHSEQSIKRVLFRKNGYDDKIVKVRTSDKNIFVKLAPYKFSADPEIHKDQELKKLQKFINPIVDKISHKLINQKGRFDYRLSVPVKVVRLNGKPYVSITIILEVLEKVIQKRDKVRQQELLQEIWKQFGGDLVKPLALNLKDSRGISGIKLDVLFVETTFRFNVSSRVEIYIEMECVSGVVNTPVFDSCASLSVSGRCISGTKYQPVYQSCIRRVPISRTKVVADPRSSIAQGKALASFVLLDSSFSTPPNSYHKLLFILKDSNGNVLQSQGNIMK